VVGAIEVVARQETGSVVAIEDETAEVLSLRFGYFFLGPMHAVKSIWEDSNTPPLTVMYIFLFTRSLSGCLTKGIDESVCALAWCPPWKYEW
jgi:hypothetical protein